MSSCVITCPLPSRPLSSRPQCILGYTEPQRDPSAAAFKSGKQRLHSSAMFEAWIVTASSCWMWHNGPINAAPPPPKAPLNWTGCSPQIEMGQLPFLSPVFGISSWFEVREELWTEPTAGTRWQTEAEVISEWQVTGRSEAFLASDS